MAAAVAALVMAAVAAAVAAVVMAAVAAAVVVVDTVVAAVAVARVAPAAARAAAPTTGKAHRGTGMAPVPGLILNEIRLKRPPIKRKQLLFQ